MKLDNGFYPDLERIEWFQSIGLAEQAHFPFPVRYAFDLNAALDGFNSQLWQDVRTEAQGDLTGYLAKHHYESYGSHWNRLAAESRDIIERTASQKIQAALEERKLPKAMLQPILTDLNRAALEAVYRKRYPKVPLFFERVLATYKAGRIPAGWEGDLDQWPAGHLVVY